MSERSISVLSPESAFARQRLAALSCLAVVLAVLFVFRETALSMSDLWYRSETYGHGFLVVPIFLWLVWQKRKQIARLPIRPYWPGLLLVGVAGFVWLVGSLAGVLMVTQFGLILMIQGAVLTILGLEISRALAFPLLFLFFAVPFGHELVPELMDRTADFTVLALQVTGVPVYREGNNFVIPSGLWSVVEACSGIRYLIASFMAGTLFAYLMYRSARRRVLFMGFAILVPIVANWLRAYTIVMIGHLSGNELAVGVDHLIYGWIFFGIVLFVMFSIGAWFREDAVEPRAGPGPIDTVVAVHGRPAWAALAALALAISWPSLASVLAATDGVRAPVQLQIEGMRGWQPVATEADGAWKPHFLGHRHELRQAFERGSERVVVDIRYYFAQAQGEELINAENVLVKTEDPKNPAWRGVARGTSELKLGDRMTRVRTAKLAGRPGKIDVAWWFWIDGRTTTSNVIAKGLLAWSRLRLQGDDSAAVFLSTEASDRGGGDELLRQFAADMGGAIEAALAAAQKGSR